MQGSKADSDSKPGAAPWRATVASAWAPLPAFWLVVRNGAIGAQPCCPAQSGAGIACGHRFSSLPEADSTISIAISHLNPSPQQL